MFNLVLQAKIKNCKFDFNKLRQTFLIGPKTGKTILSTGKQETLNVIHTESIRLFKS